MIVGECNKVLVCYVSGVPMPSETWYHIGTQPFQYKESKKAPKKQMTLLHKAPEKEKKNRR